ncbi:MAG TPA: hypothetical protein PLE59_00945 [Bacteroidales bacterium]|nr:MAG: hypothetical protein BWX59_01302 [Bacteroidetes bacterium ADurb.Bin028]HNZ77244.1 hypothetical protein [Bacilli bacterium]HOE15176.1 hypothetical protein [Candidatus Paceibacterota bacterium]HPL02064.1 hypothetical protein [Bacteroidales bacterium]HQL11811.1 hypothetical protein [bacterium]
MYIVICIGFFAFSRINVNAASGNGTIIDGPIDFKGTNVTQVVIIRDDGNNGGTLICLIGYLVETYGTNASVIIREDDNDEGTLICSVESNNVE